MTQSVTCNFPTCRKIAQDSMVNRMGLIKLITHMVKTATYFYHERISHVQFSDMSENCTRTAQPTKNQIKRWWARVTTQSVTCNFPTCRKIAQDSMVNRMELKKAKHSHGQDGNIFLSWDESVTCNFPTCRKIAQDSAANKKSNQTLVSKSHDTISHVKFSDISKNCIGSTASKTVKQNQRDKQFATKQYSPCEAHMRLMRQHARFEASISYTHIHTHTHTHTHIHTNTHTHTQNSNRGAAGCTIVAFNLLKQLVSAQEDEWAISAAFSRLTILFLSILWRWSSKKSSEVSKCFSRCSPFLTPAQQTCGTCHRCISK